VIWIAFVSELLVKGVMTYAQIVQTLNSLPGSTPEKTDALLLQVKAYIAGKYGEAVALSHFGE
jgi:hypothetical protein